MLPPINVFIKPFHEAPLSYFYLFFLISWKKQKSVDT